MIDEYILYSTENFKLYFCLKPDFKKRTKDFSTISEIKIFRKFIEKAKKSSTNSRQSMAEYELKNPRW